jgi:hypothetical protein
MCDWVEVETGRNETGKKKKKTKNGGDARSQSSASAAKLALPQFEKMGGPVFGVGATE